MITSFFLKGKSVIKPFNYRIPSDISSSAFFIVLTALTKNSKLRKKKLCNVDKLAVPTFSILGKLLLLLKCLAGAKTSSVDDE